uniref:TATA box-binding protein-associated factor RNA polymerase I subunit B n=1 Tax=Chaetoceros debilis TaxID=122233 RepID=A0A7S3V699_9STRA|mmetsp:Transcript_22166/g.33749  ORF Transcript_22166/g.33749 Transcript_22166/m.33749 type:complete len:1044 (+) Transcript_22166:1-3132(+)
MNHPKEEENDSENNDILCLNCGSSNFFRDENSDDLICSDCNTQSQSLSQRETVEDDFSTLHTRGHRTIKTSSSHIKTEDEYYTKDAVLPSLKVCVSAFLSLVEKAAICSVSVQSHGSGSGSGSGTGKKSKSDGNGNGDSDVGVMPTNMEDLEGFEKYRQNVVDDAKEIFLLYLERFDESANYFMIRYPTLRISLRDRFLTDYLRDQLWLHFHLYDIDKDMDMNGSNNNNNNNHNRETSMKDGSSDDESDDDGDGDSDDGGKNPSHRRRKGKALFSETPLSLQPPGSSRKSPKQVRWDDSQQTAIFDGTQPSNASLLSQEQDTIAASSSSQDIDRSPTINYNFNRRKRQRDRNRDQHENRDGQKERGADQGQDQEQKQLPSQSFITEHGFLNKSTDMKFGRYSCDAGASKGFKKFSDESIYWKLAVLELNIDVNFLTSIVYLAHLCSRTGISSSHFLMWASDGKFPFLWDSYSELNDDYQKKLLCIKSRFRFGHKYESGGDCDHRDELPDPSVLDRGVMLLLTSLVDTRIANKSDGKEKGGRLDKLFRSNIERMKRSEILSRNITKFISEGIVKPNNISATAANGDGCESAVEEALVSEFKIVETNSPTRSALTQEMEIEKGDGSRTMLNSPETAAMGQSLGQMSQDSEATESVDTVGYGPSQDTTTMGPSLGQLSQDSDISQTEETTFISPASGSIIDSLDDDPQPFFNVGMMTAHFCAYLGVEDKVLDFTYALMGLPVYCTKDDERREEWLPPELKLAHPSSLVSPLHVIAVIVAACKFTPGWTTWKVIRTSSEALANAVGKRKYMNTADKGLASYAHNNDTDSLCDTSSDDSSMDLNIMFSQKRRNQLKRQRSQNKATSPIDKLKKKKKVGNFEKTYDNIDKTSLTPNFVDQDRPMRFNPLNFVKPVQYQKGHGKKKNSQFFKQMLSSSFGKTLKKGSLSSSVTGNTILAGARLNEKKREDPLKLDQSNGLSEYVAYNRLRCGKKPRTGFLTYNHVHEPYKMLLRYVAERLFIDKYKLHALVLNIDEEIRYTSSQRNPSCW